MAPMNADVILRQQYDVKGKNIIQISVFFNLN
jgi:hypothetical protein